MTVHPMVNILWIIFAAGVVLLVWGEKQFVSRIEAISIIVPIFQWCMTAIVIIFPIICAIGLCQFVGYMFAKMMKQICVLCLEVREILKISRQY